MDEKRYDALEHALSELAAGKGFPDVIATTHDLEGEIKAAQLIITFSEIEIPPATIHRSRTQVLARAMQLRQESQSRWGFFHLRRMSRLMVALALAIVFLLSWNGLVYASARALPGDQLYPAKLTLERLRLGLALNPQTHQEVEQEYQTRRIDEVMRLLALGRVEFVQFLGAVDEQSDDRWIVDGIDIRLIPETIILGDILPGMTVEVEGATQPKGWVQASEIHLQRFSFFGTVEVIARGKWTISGREVLISSASQTDQDIQVGDKVIVDVISDDFGSLTARLITLYNLEDDDLQATETPEPLDDAQDESADDENWKEDDIKEETETPEPDELDETDEPGEADELDEIDEPGELDEADEPGKTNESDEPDETDEPGETDETDEPNETDESDKRNKSDQPDEPDETDEKDKVDETDKPED